MTGDHLDERAFYLTYLFGVVKIVITCFTVVPLIHIV